MFRGALRRVLQVATMIVAGCGLVGGAMARAQQTAGIPSLAALGEKPGNVVVAGAAPALEGVAALGDAVELVQAFEIADATQRKEAIAKILKRYKVDPEKVDGLLRCAFDASAIHQRFRSQGGEGVETQSVERATAAPAVSVATNFADALGTFVAERMKAEAALVFLEQFKELLKKSPEAATLVPNTVKFVTAGNVNNPAFVQLLQANLRADLRQLPVNMPRFMEAFAQTEKSGQVGVFFCRLGAVAAYNVYQKRPVQEILLLVEREAWHEPDPAKPAPPAPPQFIKDVKQLLRLVALCSRLGSNENGALLTAREIEALLKPIELDKAGPEKRRRFVYALLGFAEKRDPYLFAGVKIEGLSLADYFASRYENAAGFVAQLSDLAQSFTRLQEAMHAVTSKPKVDPADVQVALDAWFALLQRATNPPILGSLTQISDYAHEMRKLQANLQALLGIISAIDGGRYDLAVSHLVVIAYRTLSAENKFTQFLVKEGAFLATLGTAKDATEMKQALYASALPLESYRSKAESNFSIWINAYGGIRHGRERLGEQVPEAARKSDVWAVTAPIGLEFSWRLNFDPKPKNGETAEVWEPTKKSRFPFRSISLFFPVLDVGAVTAYRLEDADGKLPPLKLSNIVAPGAFVMLGIREMPVSLFFGTQYGPALRKIEVNGATFESAAWQRPTYGVSVDIPLYNLR